MCVKNKSVHRCFVGQWLRNWSGGGGQVARKSILEGGKYATVNMVTNLVNKVGKSPQNGTERVSVTSAKTFFFP